MTSKERELAIDIFEDNFTVIDTHGHYTEEEECLAIDMAIKALEQERSRLAQITQYRNDCEKLMQENEQLKKALEQKTKTGHWIEKDGYDGDTYYDCSVCGESWTTIDGTPWDNGMKFCPNCGAKMQKVKE